MKDYSSLNILFDNLCKVWGEGFKGRGSGNSECFKSHNFF